MTAATDRSLSLLRRGRILEGLTLGWNVLGVAVLAFAALAARSVALAGFGLDSLIEIGASTVVLWELSGGGEVRQRHALRLIGGAFVALALYVTVQSVAVIATRHHALSSPAGIVWTAFTVVVMFTLAVGKGRTGAALHNPVLIAEGRVTFIDGMLAGAVLVGLTLNALFGWWWADPVAGFVIVYYGWREAHDIFRHKGP
jgi:divalent metal cation (Fe/Co/Zn/Cd) transporter